MTKDELKSAVGEAIDEKLSEFWIDREVHAVHHRFLDKWMKWCDEAEKTIWNTIIKTIILAVLGLIALGVLFKYRGHG